MCSARSGSPVRNHSTIRATFMCDRSTMCLWERKETATVSHPGSQLTKAENAGVAWRVLTEDNLFHQSVDRQRTPDTDRVTAHDRRTHGRSAQLCGDRWTRTQGVWQPRGQTVGGRGCLHPRPQDHGRQWLPVELLLER